MFPPRANSQKLVTSIKPLLLQSQIFGLVTFDTNLESSGVRTAYNFFLAIIYISTIIYAVFKIVTVTNGPPIIYKTTDILILLANGSYVLTMWLSAVVNRRKFVQFLQKLLRFDAQARLNNDGIRSGIIRWMIIRFSCIFVLVGFLLSYVLMNIWCHEIIADSLSYFLILINSVFCHQTTELVLMLKVRFCHLNQHLRELVDNVTANTKRRFHVLAKVCALHHELSKLIKLFNGIFGLVLLLMFGMSFVAIVLALFYCAAEVQSSRIKWMKFFWAFFSCTSFLVDTIYVCHVCYRTIEEAKRAGEIIHQIDTEEPDMVDEIEMFSLQIVNEQVEFNAAGFFPVNFTLLFSIIGGVTTYIIILIQLSATLSDSL